MTWKKIKIAQLTTPILERLTEDARSPEKGGKGGFSISMRLVHPQTGYMIADFGSERRHPFDQERPHLSVPDLRRFINSNRQLLAPVDTFLGGWLNEEGGLSLDVSRNIECFHKPGVLCEHRWNAYLAMINQRQNAIFDVRTGTSLKGGDAMADYPEHADLFQKHIDDMARYRAEATRKASKASAESGGKSFVRIDPYHEYSDDELLQILKHIAG